MKSYKSLILVWLLTLVFGSVYAQTEKPQLTLVRNSYKEMQGRMSAIQPIAYKDKLYLGYKYHDGRFSTSLVTFDGQNWTSSIYKNKDGKIVGDNYSYKGQAVIYKDLLFMVFENIDSKYDIIRYTDGSNKMKPLIIGSLDVIYNLVTTPDKLYIIGSKNGDKRTFLYTYDGKETELKAILPEDAESRSTAYYKGKIRIKGSDKIYTLEGNRFSSIGFVGVNYTKPVIWKGELCYLAYRTLKEPCTDKEGKLVKKGLKLVSFDGEKVNLVYSLAKNHTSIDGIRVIDNELYTVQENCETGKDDFTVNRNNTRAEAYAYKAAGDCMGNFIKYKGSIFVGYSYFNNGIYDNFLTSWTFDSNNKLDFKRIKDEYVYVNGKSTRAFVSYSGYPSPVIFKGELYLHYYTNNDTSKQYLMKYTP